ncbi:mediator of RNA polymerase II transcription subunit 15-like [Anoplophora glabripennis]|uniref:mediator of RNA polymerase II transcription subunit 15-like n=1 Tax=Anoplophora glabripennis TaxID=217634 RepID=UPI0008744BB9|nr:mediator of RNA polymerase II transcription subunit 15-like [Anoplophora glabripennis]
MTVNSDSWRSKTFRQCVVNKIEEAIRQSGMNISRNSIEMENHVFQKAKNKEEYLGFAARLILHVREMSYKIENIQDLQKLHL